MPNKSLKVVPRCASSLDSFSLGMLRILCPALHCSLALRYVSVADIMKVKIVPILLMLTSCQILKTETLDCAHEYNISHKITISNNANTPLVCTQYQLSEKKNRESEAELEIDPKSSKSVKMCSYTDWMYCSLIIDQDTYTFPTNFQPYQSGEYKVNLVEVPSSDTNEFFGCGTSKIHKPSWCQNTPGTRMSTEVELPNGKKIYK